MAVAPLRLRVHPDKANPRAALASPVEPTVGPCDMGIIHTEGGKPPPRCDGWNTGLTGTNRPSRRRVFIRETGTWRLEKDQRGDEVADVQNEVRAYLACFDSVSQCI